MSATPAATGPESGGWRAEIGPIPVRFGAGRLAELGDAAREALATAGGAPVGFPRVLLVTDPGVEAAGHGHRARAALNGFAVTTFSDVAPNPTTDLVERAAARLDRPDLLVAVGGGSALDVAKALNFLFTQGGRMADFHGRGKAAKPMLPSVGVPTTAGTGSEAQSFALLSRAEDHVKMACGDPKARFRSVILDPDLLATAPAGVTATAGLDALSHAVESFVSTAANPVSKLWAKEAWRLLTGALPEVLDASTDGETNGSAAPWGDVLLGAHLAGAAIEQSMLGAAHALANPLTARFGVEHGAAVALTLPAVVRWNGTVVADGYRVLTHVAGLSAGDDPAETVALRVEELRRRAGLPATLTEAGVPEDADPAPLAADAAEQWTGTFNPRPLTRDDFTRLYEHLR